MRWEKRRMKGKATVVIRISVIFGIFFFLLLNSIWFFWTGNPIQSSFFFIFPALGIVSGLVYWSVNEGRFHDFLADKQSRAAARR